MDNNNTPNRFAANPYADFLGELPPPPKNNKKKFIIIGLVITVLLLMAGVIAALAINNRPEQVVSVPEGWKNVETSAAISVIMPVDWEAQQAETETQGNLSINLAGIGPPANGYKIGSTSISEEIDVPVFALLSVGMSKRTDQPGQAAFEQLLTDKNATPQEVYEEQGITKEELILTSAKTMIDGVEWLEVYSEAAGQYTKSLYRWTGEQAITIRLLSDNKNKLETDYNDLVLPIASSATPL